MKEKLIKIFEALEKMDRRIIFIFIGLAVILPFFIPFGFEFSVSPPVQKFYDSIGSIPPGSKVLLSADYDPASMPELYPMHLAALKQLFSRDLKVICTQLWPTGSPLAEMAFQEIAVGEFDKKYGVDYVNLGFKEGREVVMVSMGESIPKTFPTDYHGTKVEDLPIMQGVKNFNDVAMIVNISAGVPGTKEWVLQVQSRYHIKLASGTTAVSAPEFYPYLQSNQLAGLLGGMKGAAEYEKLVGRIGLGRRGMDSQSVSHIVIFIFILIGNIAYFSMGGRKKK
ncbi:MAG TPA: hypothetical protein VGB16_05900 [candidate division Zixibacteria bacterium]